MNIHCLFFGHRPDGMQPDAHVGRCSHCGAYLMFELDMVNDRMLLKVIDRAQYLKEVDKS